MSPPGSRILLLAPHPFLQERGTPIAVDRLLRALSARGERVTVLTYHEGSDVEIPGVTLERIAAPPGVRGIRPGFSWKKVVADLYLARRAARLARERPFDWIHAVEESVFIARRVSRRRSIPYVYDMDSSLSQQLIQSRPLLRPLTPLLRWLERRAIAGAAAVVAVDGNLARRARKMGARRVFVLRDPSLADAAAEREDDGEEGEGGESLRELVVDDRPIVLYVGNLEPYQGIDLLLESFARLPEGRRALLVVIGGVPADVGRYRSRAAELGLQGAVRFLGPRPVERLGHYLRQATVLVSPRIRGDNTPMKLYSYLDSGRPVVATALPCHTDVLDPGRAILTEATPEDLCRGLARALGDPELRRRLGEAGRELYREEFGPERFRETVDDLVSAMRAVAAGEAPRR